MSRAKHNVSQTQFKKPFIYSLPHTDDPLDGSEHAVIRGRYLAVELICQTPVEVT